MAYRSKYGNEKIRYDGEIFDSKLEFYRWIDLKILQKAGKIENLKRQVKIPLIEKSEYGREISYIADFAYQEHGQLMIEDTKSKATKTPLYRLKKRLVAEKYGIIIKEVEKQ